MLTQFAMPDRVQGLDIKMQRQGKIIKLQGNSLRLQWRKISAQCHVDVRAGVLAIKGAGAVNESLADSGMSAENMPDGFERICRKSESHGSIDCSFRNK